MSFDAARKRAASMTGRSLSTAEITELLTSMAELIGRVPDEIVGPNLRVRWINEDGTYTLKLLPDVDDAGHLTWRLGYSNHRAQTLQDQERSVFTEGIFDKDIRAALPYLWISATADGEPVPVPSWSSLVWNLGQAIGEMPATLAALPTSWLGTEARFIDRDHHALDVTATRDGLRVVLRGTKDENDVPAPDRALVLDPVAALEAGPVLAHAFASSYALGTKVETTDVVLEMPGARLRGFRIWPGINDENRLDSNVTPNYHSQSVELDQLATWHADVKTAFPTGMPRPFTSTDSGKHGVIVSEAQEAKERARARAQRTLNIRNAAAAEAAAREGATAVTPSAVQESTSSRGWKFWARGR